MIAQQVQQLKLGDKGDDPDHAQIELVVVDDRLKTDDFS